MERTEILGMLKHGSPTKRQVQVLEALLEKGSVRGAARKLDTTPYVIRAARKAVAKKAAKAGWSPEHDMVKPAPDGFNVKGTSTLYGDDGEVKIQWVKTQQDTGLTQELVDEALRAMSDEIPRSKPIAPPPTPLNRDLCNQFTVTDYHLGMNAWPPETLGDSWDVHIAEQTLAKWFDAAVALAPPAETAVFAQLGDFLHWDGKLPLTPESRHVLDADTRQDKMVEVSIRALRRAIRTLLETHQNVHVIMAEGNHDPASSVWLRQWFNVLYEDEPRVTVDTSPNPYYAYQFGNTSLFYHHGHKRTPKQVAEVFAAQFREIYGATKHSYAHLGHKHFDEAVEAPLMMVEQHRTLAPNDAYAARGGWLSGRDAKVITYHRAYGQVGKQYISPDMLRVAA